MRRAALSLLVVVGSLAACGGDDAPAVMDAAGPMDACDSDCGCPGDQGNELGIGKFCASLNDCSTTPSAPLCSSLGSSDTHFCTRTCPMGDNSVCGTGAECTCNASNQCGCTPSVCLGP